MRNLKKMSLILVLMMVVTTNVSAFAASRDVVVTPMEQPPVNWQYAGKTTYNKGVQEVTVSAVSSALVAIVPYWGPLGLKALSGGVVSGALAAGISGSFNMRVVKTNYYKTNTNNNGYPYYCHEIVETYGKNSSGTYVHLYTSENFFYSYQPY